MTQPQNPYAATAQPATARARLFLAAPVPGTLAEELTRSLEASREALPPCHPVPKENLHLTILFLGEQTATHLNQTLIPLIESSLSDARPGRIHLRQVVGFPDSDAPGCLVLEGYPSESLRQWQVALQKRLLPQLDVSGGQERAWRPHITMARFPATPDRAIQAMPWQEDLPVSELVLYRSDPGESGPRYTALQHWTLNQ